MSKTPLSTFYRSVDIIKHKYRHLKVIQFFLRFIDYSLAFNYFCYISNSFFCVFLPNVQFKCVIYETTTLIRP